MFHTESAFHMICKKKKQTNKGKTNERYTSGLITFGMLKEIINILFALNRKKRDQHFKIYPLKWNANFFFFFAMLLEF